MSKRHLALLMIVAACLLGCGGPEIKRVGVKATVSYKGEPVKEGQITFIAKEGTKSPFVMGAVKDGKVTIAQTAGPAPGSFEVKLVTKDENAAPVAAKPTGGRKMPGTVGKDPNAEGSGGQTVSSTVEVQVSDDDEVELTLAFD